MGRARPLSAEARLVYRCADPQVRAEELVAIAGEVRDWPRVARLATREAAVPQLWRGVAGIAETMPPDVAQHLRANAVFTDLQMQQLSLRLQKTLAALREAGVSVMLLKGAAIGALRDPSFRSRAMTDLDLLVREADIARAKAAVIASGWPETKNPVYLELLQDAHHVPPFEDPQLPGIRLELHRHLLPDDHSFAFGEAELWRDAQPAPAPFDAALVPSDVHLVLHGAVHFAWQHQMTFGTWRTMRSLALIIQAGGFDWDALVRSATAAKAGTSLYWTLRLLQRLVEVPVPAAVLGRLAPPTVEPLRAMVERHVLAGAALGEWPGSPSDRLTRTMWRLALRPRWSGHAQVGRQENSARWVKAYGTASTETRWQQLRRHVGMTREWWRFVRDTLFGGGAR